MEFVRWARIGGIFWRVAGFVGGIGREDWRVHEIGIAWMIQTTGGCERMMWRKI